MVEIIVGLTSSSSNVYGVVDNNNNRYMIMIIDVMRINQGHVGEYGRITT
jgi:hypothetical protein